MDWFRGGETSGREPGRSDDDVRMDDFRTLNQDETVQGELETNVDDVWDSSSPQSVHDNNPLLAPLSLNPRVDPGEDLGLDHDTAVVRSVITDILRLPGDYEDLGFVRWLIDRKNFVAISRLSEDFRSTEYAFSYSGREDRGDYVVLPVRRFQTIDGDLSRDDYALARREIGDLYDEWRSARRKRLANRAGIGGGILAGIVALAVGIPLGLKRAGNDIQHGNRPGPGPGPGPRPRTPWTEIEDIARRIGGGILVWIGDHPFLVIGGIVLFVRSRRG